MKLAAGPIRERGGAATELGGLHGLVVDHVVLTHQSERRRMVEVGALPTDMLMLC
jgi:hypothetical protein